MISLSEEQSAETALRSSLSSFCCSLDEDIETFLRLKAIDFERRKWCRTYLVLDEDDFANRIINIKAYFTLSYKTIIPNSSISKTLRKKIGKGLISENITMVLIGQLGKYIKETSDGMKKQADISSRRILDLAFEIIQKADEMIPCSVVLVECSHNPKVQKVYTDYGFSQFQKGKELDQFIKII